MVALGTEGSRAPTPQEQARRQQLITLGYWPAWMSDVIDAPLSVLGERFRVYYGALLHEGAPILSGPAREGEKVLDVASD